MAAEHTVLIGSRIAQARETAGLTQKELADAIPGKADGTQVSKWERGVHRPGDDTLAHIAKATGLEIAWFHASPPDKTVTPDLSNDAQPTVADLDRRLSHIEDQLNELLGRRQAPAELDGRTAEEAVDHLKRATSVMQNVLGQLGRDVGRQDLQASPAADRSKARGEAAA